MCIPIVVFFGGIQKMEKTSLFAQSVKSDFLIAKEILKPEVVVKSGIKELDQLAGGFKTGEIVLLDGNSSLISSIPNQLCVNTYRTFHSHVFYIDGGMCADPYRIARYARKMEINQKEVLEHVHISRAFTVYQLTTLLQDMLEPVIRRYKPQTLIIGRFPVLHLDSDVPSREAQTLLRMNIHKIRELTTKYDIITVFTNLDETRLSNQRNVRNILYDGVDEVVLMKQMQLTTNVELVNKQKKTMILNLARGQLSLQEFGMVI